ncbi:hypothetical protein HDU97_002923 [Phlyctochytrium planicorne]|nr:hypothetical protein HDU97_002923 [Phlyctochytrium planicorne]
MTGQTKFEGDSSVLESLKVKIFDGNNFAAYLRHYEYLKRTFHDKGLGRLIDRRAYLASRTHPSEIPWLIDLFSLKAISTSCFPAMSREAFVQHIREFRCLRDELARPSSSPRKEVKKIIGIDAENKEMDADADVDGSTITTTEDDNFADIYRVICLLSSLPWMDAIRHWRDSQESKLYHRFHAVVDELEKAKRQIETQSDLSESLETTIPDPDIEADISFDSILLKPSKKKDKKTSALKAKVPEHVVEKEAKTPDDKKAKKKAKESTSAKERTQTSKSLLDEMTVEEAEEDAEEAGLSESYSQY